MGNDTTTSCRDVDVDVLDVLFTCDVDGFHNLSTKDFRSDECDWNTVKTDLALTLLELSDGDGGLFLTNGLGDSYFFWHQKK